MAIICDLFSNYRPDRPIGILWDTPIESNMQTMIPNHLRSRVLSVTQLIFGLGIPIGQAVYGFLMDRVQVHCIFLVVCSVYALAVVIFLTMANEEVYTPNGSKHNIVD